MTTQTRIKVSRDELVARLRARDGNVCRYPDCRERLDFNVKSGPLEVTIDHWMPQYWCKANGWTPDEIWAVDNLRLMHKKCNAKKGDRVPFEDGTLPARPSKTFRYRRDKRATRSDMCEVCENGHNLGVDEVCGSCGANAQRYPRWAHVKFNECDHELFWCWVCSITPEMRPSSIGIAMRQADASEFGEVHAE